jgi:hypothetical protein
VPRVEMKYHAGMLYCPICYQDVAEAGGRCQLCGKQLDMEGQQLCHECRENKRKEAEKRRDDASRCPRCGSKTENGICLECARRPHGEDGGQFGPVAEPGDRGTHYAAGEYGGQARGSGLVSCSSCRRQVHSVAWRDGQPYCQDCMEKHGGSMPLIVIHRIGRFVGGLFKPKERVRVRVKEGKVKGK